MRLNKLFQGVIEGKVPPAFAGCEILNIHSDSRKAAQGSLFVALKGFKQSGEDFIPEAIKRGAVAVVLSLNGARKSAAEFTKEYSGVLFVEVNDTGKILKELVRKFYDNPSAKVRTIGVTGTNGKTTTTFLLESILEKANQPCGVLGTINYRINKEIFPAPNTTPDIVEIQQFLFNLLQKKIHYCVMEVSSHGLDQGRVDLIDFRVGVFTNLTSDHLDYHQTAENYFLAKAKLFAGLSKESFAIVNQDDPYAQRLSTLTQAKIYTYGIASESHFRAVDIQPSVFQTLFRIQCPGKKVISVRSRLIGLHNVYNILAAVAAGYSQGIASDIIVKGVEALDMVPGRLQKVDEGQDFHIFVDYAHTEDGLKNVLSCLKDLKTKKLIVAFGCGGNRDRTKRPKMGKVATQLADVVILTSDNPRSEDPQDIIDEIIGGCQKENYVVIVDRKEAIYYALQLAQKDDVVLIAGKGHEDYQIFKKETVHFNDKEIIEDFLAARKFVNKN